MTALEETTNLQTLARQGEAPFLVWPVSRREFYMSIGVALLPPLAWGLIIFGWRVFWMLLMTLAAAGIMHWMLRRWTARGKMLLFAHSIVAAMVMVALCLPIWPWWIVALAGALIPAALWTLGGSGRERAHVAVIAVLLLQWMIVPWLQPSSVEEGILARDRLVMGDIESQNAGPLYSWPASMSIAGEDAVRVRRPAQVAIETLDRLTELLARASWIGPGKTLAPDSRNAAQATLDDALVKRLPSVEMLMIGAVPGPLGTVSLISLAFGGLYLAYRYILRPKSVTTFFVSFVLGMALLAIWPGAFGRLGFAGVGAAWTAFPGELATLLSYAVFNSDVVFAAVIVLALPGTEPLTGRGRRVFLLTAGLLAALLARMNWNLPAATVALCALMPFAALFDRWFGKRSWMNRLMS